MDDLNNNMLNPEHPLVFNIVIDKNGYHFIMLVRIGSITGKENLVNSFI